jgi:2-oxoisovalerate dehydrogenase E1 component
MQYMSSGRLKMPLILRGCIGIGHSAATHHSGSYFPHFVNIPGFRVVVPTNPYDAKGLFATALTSNDPVIFLEHKSILFHKGPVPEEEYAIPFGEARVTREGRDCTVVAVGSMVGKSLQACEQVEQAGVDVEVIDPRTLSPLDIDTVLASVAKTGRLLIADETFQPCGIGAEISAQVVERGFDDLDAPIRRLNGAFAPTPYSPTLEAAVVPSVADIVGAVQDLMAE